ncbi:hypothetical protein [Plantactinospora soyae]|uniref:Uracil phosphoribosyltransferase n=1 Tax=Plantactinospora soyae TaxID=1544732 RepID=A0A927QX48_9ACTN|nr:hypothetical protein [Plantactinospora soyae]MBE1486302.1 uracil phosphoribosyltransferase [Plantactinospora soyae]
MRLAPAGVTGLHRLEWAGRLGAYVFSCPPGRRLLRDSTLVGSAFQDLLRRCCAEALGALLRHDADLARTLAATPADVLYILRGGLNFGLHGVLEELSGRACRVSFLSSQRSVARGRPVVTGDDYRRFNLAGSAVLCVGDIAATGRTLANALSLLAAANPALLPPRIVVVTIGTADAVRRLDELAARLALTNPATMLTVVALEGLFGVYRSAYGLPFHLDQTDFVRRGGVIAPEFRAESARDPIALLERCVVYDGGLRGFSPAEHLRSLLDYWTELCDEFAAEPKLIRHHLGVKNDFPAIVEVDHGGGRGGPQPTARPLDSTTLLAQCCAHRDRIKSIID